MSAQFISRSSPAESASRLDSAHAVLCASAVCLLARAEALPPRMPPQFDAPASGQAVGHIVPGAVVLCAILDPLDVRAAEWLLDAGAELHATLGAEAEVVRVDFAQRYDALQAQRLMAVLARCSAVAVAGGLLDGEHRWQREQAESLALGLTLLRAGHSGGQWHRLCLRHGTNGVWIDAGTGQEASAPLAQKPSARSDTGQGRRMAGILFADFAGFRHLPDEAMPPFWNGLFAAIGQHIEAFRPSILLAKTWGDGLHFVTEDAQSAAAIACAIRMAVAAHLAAESQLAGLSLRIAIHYAPVFAEYDPISGSDAYIGSQLTFAARVEPITPPGSIYATEACAAQLAIEAPGVYPLTSLGLVALAKDHGSYPLYRLAQA